MLCRMDGCTDVTSEAILIVMALKVLLNGSEDYPGPFGDLLAKTYFKKILVFFVSTYCLSIMSAKTFLFL